MIFLAFEKQFVRTYNLHLKEQRLSSSKVYVVKRFTSDKMRGTAYLWKGEP